MFVHHVAFWLKAGLSEAEIHQFEKGVKSLETIKEHIVLSNVGKPAGTDRPVIDTSYSYALLLVFKDRENQDAYQVHPTHEHFVDTCKHLWDKVWIYDSVTI